MQKIIFILFFIFKISIILCQNQYEISSDSLLVLIRKTNNENLKIDYYIKLCELNKNNDLSRLNEYKSELFILSKKCNSKRGLGLYYYYESRLLIRNDQLNKALVTIEKALGLLRRDQDWDNYFMSSAQSVEYLLLKEDYSKAENRLNEDLKLALVLKNKNVSHLYFQISQLYNFKSDYNNALIYAEKAMRSEKNVFRKVIIYDLAANISSCLKNFTEALHYNQLSIELAKSNSIKEKFLLTRANIFFKMGRFKEALNLALNFADGLKKNRKNFVLNGCTLFISKCYFYLKDYNQANKYVEETLKAKNLRTDLKIEAIALKSKIFLKQNQLQNAQKHIDKALLLLDDTHYYEIKLFVYETKLELEERLGNYKTALRFLKKITEIKDVNYENDNEKKLNQLQINFNISQKENTIKSLELQELKNTIKIEKQKSYIIYISAAFFIALLSILFYMKNNHIIKKKNRLIENEKLRTQKSLQEKEILLKEIHHRVKNNLQLVKSLLYLQFKQQDMSLKSFVEASQSRILSMALIHENLYLKEDFSQVDFKEYTHKLAQSIQETYQNTSKQIELKVEIDEIYLDMQKAIPLGLIINELVTNAYKHAFVNKNYGNILVFLKRKNKIYHELNIIDDGDGIGKFKRAVNSLGLDLVHQLVAQIDGKLFLIQEEGMHFKIYFKNI